MKRIRILSLFLTLCLLFSLSISAFAAEETDKTIIYDTAGNPYTLDKPYVSAQSIQSNGQTVTQYTLQPNTTVTAPDGILFHLWLGISHIDDNSGGGFTEVSGTTTPIDGWEHEFQTDIGTRLYLLVLPDLPFTDVKLEDYFCGAVIWAIENGITNGTTATTFSPANPCTQAQILTFQWRAAGSPEPTIESPFTNAAISANQYYYKAMLWAYEEGIVTNAALDPNAGCSRSDVVLYLWRQNGQPAATASAFNDVPANAEYAAAVGWAVEAGITNGTSGTTFSPSTICNRGQIVTFLLRNFQYNLWNS